MAALIRVMGVVLAAVIPGGLVVLSAFILARLFAEKVRLQSGPHRYTQAFAQVRARDVWNETRRSLL